MHVHQKREKKNDFHSCSACRQGVREREPATEIIGCGKTLFLHHVKYRMSAQLLQRKLHATFINYHPKDKHLTQGPGFQKLTASRGMFIQFQWLSLHIRQYFNQELMYPLLANLLGFYWFCSKAQVDLQMVLCVCDTTVHHCIAPWVE